MKKMNNKKNRVVVWGTFDILHKGHLEFLKHASNFGDLHVIIVPDKAVYENKGRWPHNTAKIRRTNIEKLACVKGAVIDSVERKLTSLLKIRPNIFCLGYDQDEKWARKALELSNLSDIKLKFVRLHEYANGIHTSTLSTLSIKEANYRKYKNKMHQTKNNK